MYRQWASPKLVSINFIFIAFLLFGTGVMAQDFGVCTGDVMKFCQSVERGEGSTAKCLVQNRKELSPGCQSRVSALTEQVKEADEACQDDIMLQCSEVQPGGGRIVECLKERESWLSFNCKVKMGLIGFQK
jgi:hypothetical protein